jgi:hypothetical protein
MRGVHAALFDAYEQSATAPTRSGRSLREVLHFFPAAG